MPPSSLLGSLDGADADTAHSTTTESLQFTVLGANTASWNGVEPLLSWRCQFPPSQVLVSLCEPWSSLTANPQKILNPFSQGFSRVLLGTLQTHFSVGSSLGSPYLEPKNMEFAFTHCFTHSSPLHFPWDNLHPHLLLLRSTEGTHDEFLYILYSLIYRSLFLPFSLPLSASSYLPLPFTLAHSLLSLSLLSFCLCVLVYLFVLLHSLWLTFSCSF